jgi:integrase
MNAGRVDDTPASVRGWCAVCREGGRHSFVSLLSDNGVPLEDIARLVGHSGMSTTETVYRKQIRPVMIEGASAMDDNFRDRAATGELPPADPA